MKSDWGVLSDVHASTSQNRMNLQLQTLSWNRSSENYQLNIFSLHYNEEKWMKHANSKHILFWFNYFSQHISKNQNIRMVITPKQRILFELGRFICLFCFERRMKTKTHEKNENSNFVFTQIVRLTLIVLFIAITEINRKRLHISLFSLRRLIGRFYDTKHRLNKWVNILASVSSFRVVLLSVVLIFEFGHKSIWIK